MWEKTFEDLFINVAKIWYICNLLCLMFTKTGTNDAISIFASLLYHLNASFHPDQGETYNTRIVSVKWQLWISTFIACFVTSFYISPVSYCFINRLFLHRTRFLFSFFFHFEWFNLFKKQCDHTVIIYSI